MDESFGPEEHTTRPASGNVPAAEHVDPGTPKFLAEDLARIVFGDKPPDRPQAFDPQAVSAELTKFRSVDWQREVKKFQSLIMQIAVVRVLATYPDGRARPRELAANMARIGAGFDLDKVMDAVQDGEAPGGPLVIDHEGSAFVCLNPKLYEVLRPLAGH